MTSNLTLRPVSLVWRSLGWYALLGAISFRVATPVVAPHDLFRFLCRLGFHTFSKTPSTRPCTTSPCRWCVTTNHFIRYARRDRCWWWAVSWSLTCGCGGSGSEALRSTMCFMKLFLPSCLGMQLPSTTRCANQLICLMSQRPGWLLRVLLALPRSASPHRVVLCSRYRGSPSSYPTLHITHSGVFFICSAFLC